MKAKTIAIGLLLVSATLVLFGAGGSQQIFNDGLFKIYSNVDTTRRIKFDAHGISTGTTRTILMADKDVNLFAPTFDDLTVSNPSNIYGLNHDSFSGFVANEHIDWTSASVSLLTGGTISGSYVTGLTGGAFGNLSLANGSITAGGSISFGNENLSTSGNITTTAGSLTSTKLEGYGDSDTYWQLAANTHQFFAGGTHMFRTAWGIGGFFEINPNNANIDIRIHGDTNNYVFLSDGGNENVVINGGSGASFSANFDLALAGDGILALKETSTPTADTNYGKIYWKNDNKLYGQDGAGSEHEVAFADGVSGTLELDDGSTEKIILVFTDGILTSRTVTTTTGSVLADWTD